MHIAYLIPVWILILYLPFAMRSWRAFLALCAVYLVLGFGVRLGVATYTAAQVPAALVFLGDFWLDFVVIALPITVIARAIVLGAKSLGLAGRRLLIANVIAVLALPAAPFVQDFQQRWNDRPAPLVCTTKPIPLTLAGVNGALPWNNALSLYLGRDITETGRYLVSASHRRSLCRATSNGAAHLTVAAISLKPGRGGTEHCEAPDMQPWEQRLCADTPDQAKGVIPSQVIFFDPEGIRLGDFGIPSTATEAEYPVAEGQFLVSVPGQGHERARAACRAQPGPQGLTRCQMRRTLTNGVDIYWEAYLPTAEVEAGVPGADSFALSVCAAIFALPACGGVMHPMR